MHYHVTGSNFLQQKIIMCLLCLPSFHWAQSDWIFVNWKQVNIIKWNRLNSSLFYEVLFINEIIHYSKFKNPQHYLTNVKSFSFHDHFKNCNIWNVRLEKSLFRHKIITTMITYFLLDWERELVREIVDVNYYSINKHVLRKFGVESRSCN